MITEVKEILTKDQGFYPDSEVWKIKKMYSDRDRWRVIVLGE